MTGGAEFWTDISLPVAIPIFLASFLFFYADGAMLCAMLLYDFISLL